MAYYVSYKGDNDGRRAVRDLVSWFGFRKSLLIFRDLYKARRFFKAHPEKDLNSYLSRVDLLLCMGGVSGEPVRRLFARVFGEEALQKWLAAA